MLKDLLLSTCSMTELKVTSGLPKPKDDQIYIPNLGSNPQKLPLELDTVKLHHDSHLLCNNVRNFEILKTFVFIYVGNLYTHSTYVTESEKQ